MNASKKYSLIFPSFFCTINLLVYRFLKQKRENKMLDIKLIRENKDKINELERKLNNNEKSNSKRA